MVDPLVEERTGVSGSARSRKPGSLWTRLLMVTALLAPPIVHTGCLQKAAYQFRLQQKVRDHGFGKSYQCSLLVRTDSVRLARSERELQHDLRRVVGRAKAAACSTVGAWFAIGLLVMWLDRLSRGYMTWRLRTYGALAGLAVPAACWLL